MITKGKTKGSIKFSIRPAAGVKQVQLAGDFNAWKPAGMKKQKDGSFSLALDVPDGHQEYKYIVDGMWVVDPDNSHWALNAYGTLNSVVEI